MWDFILRKPQLEAINKLQEWEQQHEKIGLVHCACGIGKTHIFLHHINMNKNYKKVLLVFPTLILLNQQVNNYLLDTGSGYLELYKRDNILITCSDTDINDYQNDINIIKTVTDPCVMKQFMDKYDNSVYIVSTYKTLPVLLSVTQDNYFDICIYDEAHKFTLFTKNEEYSFLNKGVKHVLYTATPKLNETWSKIRLNPIFRYNHIDGVIDKICKDFEIVLNISDINTDNNYESVIRLVSKYYDHKKWLFYHRFINANMKTDEGMKEFTEKYNNTFIEHDINHYSIDMNTKMYFRKHIISEFESNIGKSVLSSVNTLCEGIDINGVSAVCFIKPRKSGVYVAQAIGRACRIHSIEDINKKALVVVPLFINKKKYNNINDISLDDKDVFADWESLIKICSSIYTENHELYDSYIDNPNTLTKHEIQAELERQNFTINYDNVYDNPEDTIEYKINGNIFKWNDNLTSEENFKLMSEAFGTTIQLIEDDLDNEEIRSYGNHDNVTTLFHNSIENNYRKINPKSENKAVKAFSRKLYKEKRLRPFNIKLDNQGFGEDWILSNDVIGNMCVKILKYNIEKRLFRNWDEKHKLLESYLLKHKELPCKKHNDVRTQILMAWISDQREKYKANVLSKDKIDKLESLDKWKWFIDIEAEWEIMYNKVKYYYLTNNNYPSRSSNDRNIKEMGEWIHRQRSRYYKTATSFRKITEDEIFKLESIPGWQWNKDYDADWESKLEEIRLFCDKCNKLPSEKSSDNYEQKLGNWIRVQKRNLSDNKLPQERLHLLNTIKSWFNWYIANTDIIDIPNISSYPLNTCHYLYTKGSNAGKMCSIKHTYSIAGYQFCCKHRKIHVERGYIKFSINNTNCILFLDTPDKLSDPSICDQLALQHIDFQNKGYKVSRFLSTDPCLLDKSLTNDILLKGCTNTKLSEYHILVSKIKSLKS